MRLFVPTRPSGGNDSALHAKNTTHLRNGDQGFTPASPPPAGFGPVEESTPTRPVGIDKGLKHRVVTSDGHYIPPLVPDRRLIKRTSRSLNRAKRGSKSRLRKRQAHAKAWRRYREKAVQADFRLAHWLTETYDAIVTEDLM